MCLKVDKNVFCQICYANANLCRILDAHENMHLYIFLQMCVSVTCERNITLGMNYVHMKQILLI
jgi:hypothetical protein